MGYRKTVVLWVDRFEVIWPAYVKYVFINRLRVLFLSSSAIIFNHQQPVEFFF